MKAVLCVEPGRLEVIEQPLPEPDGKLVPVEIRAIGICGTDFHIYEGKHPFLEYPRVMGHELSGVVGAGSPDPSLPPGTQVVINPYLSCGHCIACRKGKPNCCATLKVLGVHIDGGMCERLLLPAGNLYPADHISLRDAAMVEFQAIGAHAVRRSEVKPGDRVLIVGAGPIGVGTAFFARIAGGTVTLTDISAPRRAYLRDRLGFERVIAAGESALPMMKETDGELYDVVFDATGNARAMENSFQFVASGGTLVFVGVLKADITFFDPEFHRKEITLRASRNATRQDFETVMAAMARGDIPMDALNTHSGHLLDLPKAMPAWLASKEPPLKAIVTL